MILSLDIFRFTNNESGIVTPDTINLRDNVAAGVLLDFSVILGVAETVGSERRRHLFFRFILEELSWDAENFVASGIIHFRRLEKRFQDGERQSNPCAMNP